MRGERCPVWVPACGGSEVPFRTWSGRRVLYVFDVVNREHGYLNLDTDLILTPQELKQERLDR